MRGMSYVHMAGTIGNVPQMGTTRDGTPWARIRLAVTRWDHGNQGEATDWWTIKLYGANATRAEKILRPGVGVVFRGTPQLEEWTDKDSAKHHDLSVRADSFTVVRYPAGPRPDSLQPTPLHPQSEAYAE